MFGIPFGNTSTTIVQLAIAFLAFVLVYNIGVFGDGAATGGGGSKKSEAKTTVQGRRKRGGRKDDRHSPSYFGQIRSKTCSIE